VRNTTSVIHKGT